MTNRITKKLLYDKIEYLNSLTKEQYVVRRMYNQYYIYTQSGYNTMCGTIKELFYQVVFAIRILQNEQNVSRETSKGEC